MFTPASKVAKADAYLQKTVAAYEDAKLAASQVIFKAAEKATEAERVYKEALADSIATTTAMDKLIRRAEYAKTNITNLFVPPDEQ